MDKREAGKRNAVEFVSRIARSMNLETTPFEFLWWPEIPAPTAGAGVAVDTTMPLRVYKGSSWRAIEFAGSDIDRGADNPELLNKYEREAAQVLKEL